MNRRVTAAASRLTVSRRDLLRGGLASAAGAWMLAAAAGRSAPAQQPAQQPAGNAENAGRAAAEAPGVVRGRIRQSVMGWCFQPMDAVTLAKHCLDIGIEAMEGIPAEAYPQVTQMGLKISLTGSHGFANGPLDPDNHAMVEAKLREGIDLAARYGAPNVITFTGMTKAGISEAAAKKNCVACWKRVLPYAEEKGVGIVLEHLNTRDDSHPMKGHPGYWGDDLELCADLIRAVDSPRFKLLFDIYHVQVMHGDLIRRIRQYSPIIGHYHTAGCPGRGELDTSQEIFYPPVIRAILETGYKGYLAQEFIPTWDDPVAALRHAASVCDV
ncbi:TIM barrel protein [Roseimaritima sediminicola]|uniref:TIM barrel protein n=1 Tax=Roseimaritima sediminicola TaxID=2662066 RepID=UPI001F481F9C|nr:TIM barrel protein [Roseimaritima sediminicola]